MTLTNKIRAARMEAQAHERHAQTCHAKANNLFRAAYPLHATVSYREQNCTHSPTYFTGVIVGHGRDSSGCTANILVVTPCHMTGNRRTASLLELERDSD